jgi:hypothetical protein
MKLLSYIPLLIFLSCSSPSKKPDPKIDPDSSSHSDPTKQVNKSNYYTTKDSLLISTETNETLKYSKEEFNSIIDAHPELYSGQVQDPDAKFYCGGGNKAPFSSEGGQDEYYMLYAYFLKQKNGIEEYAERRKTLIDIYLNINSLFQHFQYGGTYFGHQPSRILGYAEYSVYLYKEHENTLTKTYDISKQKEYYIKLLRQLIEDESKIGQETSVAEKTKSKKELNKIVDNIDREISDIFYLRRAQEFQYEYYEYY